MTLASKKSIDKLGDRFRKSVDEPGDRVLLQEYQRIRCAGLAELFSRLVESIRDIPHAFSCRVKRVDTIIRKLRRVENRGMDLTRMDDVIGFRVIAPSRLSQDELVKRLGEIAGTRIRHDYIVQPQASGYRAIHLVVDQQIRLGDSAASVSLPCEIQVRTYYQHLWASTSESFGEQVKEGGGSENVRSYLDALAAKIRQVEVDLPTANQTGLPPAGGGVSFFVLQFDKRRGELINSDGFGSDVSAAMNFALHLDDLNTGNYRHETVLLCVPDGEAELKITHVRYFQPDGIPSLPKAICPSVSRPKD